MKHICLFICIGLYGVTTAWSQSFSSPVDYLNLINGEQSQVTTRNLAYISESVHNDNLEQVEKKRKLVVSQIKRSVEKIRQLPAYEKETRLRDEAIAVLEEYQNAFNLDFKQINEMKAGRTDSYESMDAYFKAYEKAEKKVEKAGERYDKAQEIFAKKHEIQLLEGQESEMAKQVRTVNQVNDYSRRIFLMYFRVSRHDGEFWKAVDAKKATLAERHRQSLLTHAQEVKTELSAFPPFREDSDYRDQTLKLINFYLKMAGGDYSKMTKTLPMLEKTPKFESQAEVDAYNAKIEEFNEIVQFYNQSHQELVYNFNQSNAQMMQKHVPRPASQQGTIKM